MKTILFVLFLIMLARAGDSPDGGSSAYDGCKITTMLREGSDSSDVACLERRLQDLGYSTDGQNNFFGQTTRKSVISYQTKFGLTIDGVVGPETGGSLKIWGGSSTPPNTTDPPVGSTPGDGSTVQTAPPVVETTPIPSVISQTTEVIVVAETLPPIDISLGNTPATSG